MIHKTIALCIFVGLVAACTRSPQPGTNPETLVQIVRILEAEDTRQWNPAAMEGLFSSPDPQLRARTALAAGRIGDAAAVQRLTDLINKDADESVATTAAFAIGEIESAEGAEPLLQALHNSKSNTVRARAVEGLGKIGAALPEKDVENRKRIGVAIVEALKGTQPDTHFTSLALTAALRAKPEGGPAAVAAFLTSPSARVREDALNALARLRAKESLDQVRTMLTNDNDSLTRANAARVLGAAADKAPVSPLVSAMSSDTDLRVRVAAIRALAAIAEPSAATALLKRTDTGKNERLEIATALGRILPNTNNAEAIAFLVGMRKAGIAGPEIEIAFAKIAPQQYVNDPAVKNPTGDWQHVSAIAQGLGELAASKQKEQALLIVKTLVQSAQTPEGAMYDVLQALKAFKTPNLASIALTKLKARDFVTRAAAADILAELPPSAGTTQALIDALHAANADKQSDAALSIIGALTKAKDKTATAAIGDAAKSTDYLVRRRANEAMKELKEIGLVNIGAVNTRNTKADYERAAARIGKQPKATITTDKGVITIQFYPADAPLTVDSFIRLAQAHFFDGLNFHRVVPNFVIQGGDPRGDGNGGPGYAIRCEINMQPYDAGAVGMALSGKDTGGSQFFITHSPQPHLDGGYTVFAHVISGQNVVDKIERGDRVRTVTIQE